MGSGARIASHASALLLVSLLLGACGMVSDNTASSLLVTPRKYQFYNCQLLAGHLKGARIRIDDLQKLMARASQSPAGQAIAVAAYRTEYLQAQGDEKQILAAAKEKNCQNDSSWASERSLY